MVDDVYIWIICSILECGGLDYKWIRVGGLRMRFVVDFNGIGVGFSAIIVCDMNDADNGVSGMVIVLPG